MQEKTDKAKEMNKKGFFKRIMEKIDKKMEEKAKSKACCCSGPKDKDNNSCCS